MLKTYYQKLNRLSLITIIAPTLVATLYYGLIAYFLDLLIATPFAGLDLPTAVCLRRAFGRLI